MYDYQVISRSQCAQMAQRSRMNLNGRLSSPKTSQMIFRENHYACSCVSGMARRNRTQRTTDLSAGEAREYMCATAAPNAGFILCLRDQWGQNGAEIPHNEGKESDAKAKSWLNRVLRRGAAVDWEILTCKEPRNTQSCIPPPPV